MAVDIPNYRIIEKLGVGANSRIFRARCMRTGQDYAVKIVKIVKPEDAGFVELLKSEHAIGSVGSDDLSRKKGSMHSGRHSRRPYSTQISPWRDPSSPHRANGFRPAPAG